MVNIQASTHSWAHLQANIGRLVRHHSKQPSEVFLFKALAKRAIAMESKNPWRCKWCKRLCKMSAMCCPSCGSAWQTAADPSFVPGEGTRHPSPRSRTSWQHSEWNAASSWDSWPNWQTTSRKQSPRQKSPRRKAKGGADYNQGAKGAGGKALGSSPSDTWYLPNMPPPPPFNHATLESTQTAISASTSCERDRRAAEIPCLGENPENLIAKYARGCHGCFGSSGYYDFQGGDEDVPPTCDNYGTMQERSRHSAVQLEKLQDLMGAILPKYARPLGKAYSSLRRRRKELLSTTERSQATAHGGQEQDQDHPREGNGRGKRGDDCRYRRGGTSNSGSDSKHKEDARCNERCYDYAQRLSRRHITKEESLSGISRRRFGESCRATANPNGAFSLGCTTSLPYLGRWEQPNYPAHYVRSVKWADDPSCLYVARHDSIDDPARRWEQMKPDWTHSIQAESDFKSPLEALRQGFLLEQTFLEIVFDDDRQRFELYVGKSQFDANSPDMRETDDTLMSSDAGSLSPKVQDSSRLPEITCLVDCISPQDIEALCLELSLDEEEFVLTGISQKLPVHRSFHLHFDAELPWQEYHMRLTKEESEQIFVWRTFFAQWSLPHGLRVLRLHRVHTGPVLQHAGPIHLTITTWHDGQVPGLIAIDTNTEIFYYALRCITQWREALSWMSPTCDLPEPEKILKLWHRGCNQSCWTNLPLQCGTLLSLDMPLDRDRPALREHRIDEMDVIDPPVLDFDADEPMVFPEDVQGRDEPVAIISDDENLIVQALAARQDAGSLQVILFGYDGEAIGRRDQDVTPATFEALQHAIERAYQDYQGHFIKPYLVRPQPVALMQEGLVFVVAIQHVFAGAPIPRQNHALCLAGMQLSYAGSTEPDVHRAFELESSFDMHDVQMALQINTLCQPRGRRLCTFQAEDVPMIPMMEYNALSGSYITVDIQEERPVFNIQRACQELDSVLDDIQLAQQDEQIRQIQIIQHGYRYRSLGTVNQPWTSTSIDPVAVAQNFAAGWIQQPLDRSQIYRVKAMDNVDTTL